MWAAITAIVGVIGTIVGVGLGARLNSRSQDRRLLAEQQSIYARERAAQLRNLYSRMAQSAATLQAIVYERNYVTTADGTIEMRDKRHATMLNDAQRVIAEIGGEIIVEPAIDAVRESYTALRKEVTKYQIAEELEPAGIQRAEKIRVMEQEIGRLSLEVGDLGRAHLHNLDTPPALAPAPPLSLRHPIRSLRG